MVKLNTASNDAKLNEIITKDELKEFQNLILNVPVSDNVIQHAVNFVHKTRPDNNDVPDITKKYIEWGAGPRASSYLILAAKAYAILNGNPTPEIDHINAVIKPILRHRVILNFNAEAEGIKIDNILDDLLSS